MNSFWSRLFDLDLLMLDKDKKIRVDETTHDPPRSGEGHREYPLDTQGVVPGGCFGFITILDRFS